MTVVSALVPDVDARRCRERCTLLLSAFKAKMTKGAAASDIEKEHIERDELLANVLELFEDAEAARDDKKQEKAAKQRDDKRANAMAMSGIRGRNSKHVTFTELLTHVKKRYELTRALEMRKR
ncbi:hypothetical protein GN244_ATG09122 [Phytophthora infestans]|uniref:Uncharacterized protein n=1 Tax=Phytophthora infestans TaxID=4787 RepID=A0A833TCQ2_PHYIN|nr:hypothetical protein GN244_ATG09122 [Phytophthora infestans]